MKRIAMLVLLVSALAAPVAQGACRVLDPELQGSFSGGCSREGLAEGLGAAKGSAEYVGGFRAGKKHGQGVKVWPWGDRYVGGFVEDRKEGRGIYVFGPQTAWAGDKYVGEYRNDMRQGQGVYEWASGERYEGSWEADRMSGPPTPMAVQRGRHLRAVQEALKPGVKVCRTLALGVGGKEIAAGRVERFSGNAVGIRLETAPSQPVNGATLRAGDVLWDNPVHWLPCQ